MKFSKAFCLGCVLKNVSLARRKRTEYQVVLIYPRLCVVESSTLRMMPPVAKTSQGPIPPSFWISRGKGKSAILHLQKGEKDLFSVSQILVF
jgi:hypothetical protein